MGQGVPYYIYSNQAAGSTFWAAGIYFLYETTNYQQSTDPPQGLKRFKRLKWECVLECPVGWPFNDAADPVGSAAASYVKSWSGNRCECGSGSCVDQLAAISDEVEYYEGGMGDTRSNPHNGPDV